MEEKQLTSIAEIMVEEENRGSAFIAKIIDYIVIRKMSRGGNNMILMYILAMVLEEFEGDN